MKFTAYAGGSKPKTYLLLLRKGSEVLANIGHILYPCGGKWVMVQSAW